MNYLLIEILLEKGGILKSRARLFKTNDVVSQRFVKISNVNISDMPIFFVEKM